MRLEAYVHESDGQPGKDPGTGWVQFGLLSVESGRVDQAPKNGTLLILDGSIHVDQTPFRMLPLPFKYSGSVSLRFVGAEGFLLVTGTGIELELLGDPVFVENFW